MTTFKRALVSLATFVVAFALLAPFRLVECSAPDGVVCGANCSSPIGIPTPCAGAGALLAAALAAILAGGVWYLASRRRDHQQTGD
jgi:hypothetical protein